MTAQEYEEQDSEAEHTFINHVFNIKYDYYVNDAIRTIKNFPKEAKTSAQDSGLHSFWEEWAFQLQIGESVFYDLFVETIETICECIVESMPDHEILGLWLFSAEGYVPDDLEDLPDHGEMIGAIRKKLFERVCSVAIQEKLPDEVIRRYEEVNDTF